MRLLVVDDDRALRDVLRVDDVLRLIDKVDPDREPGRLTFITRMGAHTVRDALPPLVDKIMIAAAFISLVPLKAVPAWAATVIVARDFLITGLRMMAAAKR